MKMTTEEENSLRIQFSKMVQVQFNDQMLIKLRVDMMIEELTTLLPQETPNLQQMAEAKEIVIAHYILEQ